jgi:soluble lytic murein transglycosylase
MRELDWKAAVTRFAGLPQAQQSLPEFRYARAYCAAELADPERVLSLTEGLSEHLPLFQAELARMRALAQLQSGQHAQAAAYFANQQDPRDLLRAATALRANGDYKQARQLVDRALSRATSKKGGDQELIARIRTERVRVSEQQRQTALMALDLRWLALRATTTTAALGADQKLEALGGHTLTKQQRYQRATDFADAGKVEAVQQELELLAKAPGPGIKAAELLYVQAMAHYSKREYSQAAKLFDQATAAGTKQRLKATFFAARALSRANQDLQAIERYQNFARAYPATGYTEDAHYLVGRLHYGLGNWKEAAIAYNKYLTKYSSRGRHQKTARYELAVTRLAQRDFDKALQGFERLVRDETSARLKPRYQLLEAIALAGKNEQAAAAKSFRSLITTGPLTFAALSAQRRLVAMGEEPPPPMPAAKQVEAPPPLKVELPPKVALLKRIGLDHVAESELLAHEAKLKARHRPREYESLCAAYSQLAGAARLYRVGQAAASWSLLLEPPTNQTRWLWDCVYPRPYANSVTGAEAEFKLPEHLIYSVMRQESTFLPSVVSSANAVGLMQMIEPTAHRVTKALQIEYDVSLLEVPRHNIRFGAYYLRRLLDNFGQNPVLALAAYNAGPNAVSRWLESGEQLDLDVFVARIPYRETRGYVERVVENLARYAYLKGGVAAVPQLDLKIQPGLRAADDAY